MFLNRQVKVMKKGLLAVCLCSLVFTGCISLEYDGNKQPKPTAGQELIDLKAALDKGVINKDEYETKRKKILER